MAIKDWTKSKPLNSPWLSDIETWDNKKTGYTIHSYRSYYDKDKKESFIVVIESDVYDKEISFKNKSAAMKYVRAYMMKN